MQEYYIGLMSGTSLDGIDAVLVNFEPNKANLISALCHPFDKMLRSQVADMLSVNWTGTLKQFGILDQAVGIAFAEAANALLQQAGIKAAEVRAIGSHGQTLWHEPVGTLPFTLQAGDPNQIAERTSISVVADFRRRDMAAGGQGAPLVPAFHKAMFADLEHHRTVLNIGGIANITVLPPELDAPIWGFDTGPGNTLIDQWAFKYTGEHFDRNGNWARSGELDEELLQKMLKDVYFKLPPPKSTGRERFNLGWVAQCCGQRHIEPLNIQTTLTELTAVSISHAIAERAAHTEEILVCGGGAHNNYLLERIQHHSPDCKLMTTTDLGVNVDWVEAIAFAWLAKRTIENRPGNIPSATGAQGERVLGGIFPA